MAFIGIFDISTIFMIASVASVLEIVIAILDTPFLYLSKYLDKIDNKKQALEN